MIRSATQNDYAPAEAIMEQVQDLHADWRPDVYRAGATVLTPDYFDELVRAGQVLVYEEKGSVAGVVIFRERQAGGPVKMERKTLYIDSIAVDEAHRGRGIGRRLLDECKAIARNRGCCGLELQVNAANARAMKLYREYGFGEKSVNMELNF
ncbi:GNAT family N-acetyltransferase [Candidatus Allofournierella excrementavium]|uniref:GNAT family N-acetyltransferase n=1 Tax=Candidatus Allofournierella excrementavium TaxID=2838591 RepID=UPI003AF7DB4E